jgi:aspartate/methionine/tyrosine aminotransferase
MKMEPFALERWMTTWETQVKYDIAESGILPLRANDLLELLPEGERAATLEALMGLRLGYSEARGSEELRGLLAATYKSATGENILVTTGAIEANFLLFHVLLEPGDHVVACYPAYQQLYSVPRAIGCEVTLWEARQENGFRFDPDDLERLVTAKTRLIVINTPHNPTGTTLSEAELRRVYALAESAGAMVLSDEAYRWLRVPGGDALAPPLFDFGPRAVSVGTLSKPFGLPGLRIGWMAAHGDLAARCWGMRDYVSLSPGRLNDALAAIAVRNREKIFERNRGIIEANLETAKRWIAERADFLDWRAPKGGLLSLFRYHLPMASLDLANLLAERYSVMLAPGSAFGYEHHLRMGIGQDPAVFAAGLERTAECFAHLRESKPRLTAATE